MKELRPRDWSDYLGGVVFLVALLMMAGNAFGVTALHHWTLDNSGGLTDQVGDWNMATNATSGAAGMFNEGYHFNSTQIMHNDSASGITGNWTACAWINQDSVGTTQTLLSLRDPTHTGVDYAEIQLTARAPSGGPYKYGIYTGNSSDYALATGTTDQTTGVWVFVCGEWNETYVSVWVNGTEEAATSATLTPLTSGVTSASIGAADGIVATGSWDWEANGTIDEVWIFDDALTSQQINDLMNFNSIRGTATLTSPANNTHDDNVTWVYVPSWLTTPFNNCSLIVNNTQRATNTTALVNNANNTLTWTPSTDGRYDWYVSCNNSGTLVNSTTWTFYYDTAIHAYNEDTNASISTFNITWNGVTYTTTNGTIYGKTLADAYNGTGYLIASATGYEDRQLYVNMSEDLKHTFYLLETAKGADKTLHITNPTTGADEASTRITLSLNGYDLDTRETNSSGYVTFFMNDSKNYCVSWNGNSYCNSISVTIKQPFDEKDGTTTIANFSVSVTGPVSYSYTNLNADKTFNTYLFQDTTSILVENSTYTGRTYYIKGGEVGSQNATIQPYLLKTGDGAWNFFVVMDQNSAQLPGVWITFFRQIGGTYHSVGMVKTDNTGSGQIYLDPLVPYYITFSKYPYSVYSTTLNPQGTTYYTTLVLSGTGGTTITSNITYMDITPKKNIAETDTITALMLNPYADIREANFTIYWNGTAVYNQSTTNVGTGVAWSVNVSSLGVTLDYWHPLKSKLCGKWYDGTVKCVYDYGKTGESNTGLTAGITLMKADFAGSSEQNINLVPALFATLFMLLAGMAGVWMVIITGFAFMIMGIMPLWLVLVAAIVGIGVALWRGEI